MPAQNRPSGPTSALGAPLSGGLAGSADAQNLVAPSSTGAVLPLEEALAEITSTATWDQSSSWAAAESEEITGTAAFSQDPGGQPLSSDTADEFLTDEGGSVLLTGDDAGGWLAIEVQTEPITGTATFEQSQAWAATQTESLDATAAFSQSVAWAAAASESIPTTATWTQSAAWSAAASSAEPVNADATFTQEAAAWTSTDSESYDATATWSQGQQWDAAATETISSSATWSQAQAWAAIAAEAATGTASFAQSSSFAAEAEESEPITGAWAQSQAWAAEGDSEAIPVDVDVAITFVQSQGWASTWRTGELAKPRIGSPRGPTTVRLVKGTATFEQSQGWAAVMHHDDALLVEDEELLLAIA